MIDKSSVIFLNNQSVVWAMTCQKTVKNVFSTTQGNMLECVVLYTTQTYSVYCRQGMKKPENIASCFQYPVLKAHAGLYSILVPSQTSNEHV